MRRPSLAALTVIALAACAACSGRRTTKNPPPVPPAGSQRTPGEHDAAAIRAALRPDEFDEALRIAAKSYRRWPRVSDDAHFSPTDCHVPRLAGALSSQSQDESTHGRKLYHLYANLNEYKREPFRWMSQKSQRRSSLVTDADADPDFSPGLTVVKETWTPVEVPKADVPVLDGPAYRSPLHPPEYLVVADRAWKMGEQRDLFIMLRAGGAFKTGTDEGWVYAVVSSDGETIRCAGRIQSCMDCHEHARFERLFGPKWAHKPAR